MKKIFLTIIALLFCSNTFAAEKEYSIKIQNHRFEPAIVEVAAGEKFRLIVENLDKTAEEFESHDLNKEKIIGGGKKAVLIIGPLKAGEYKFFGEFHEDTAQGKIIAK